MNENEDIDNTNERMKYKKQTRNIQQRITETEKVKAENGKKKREEIIVYRKTLRTRWSLCVSFLFKLA